MCKSKIYAAVIADDVTGANDIGIMFANAGIETVVYNQNMINDDFVPVSAVNIIDTNSRFLTYEEAYNKVYAATKLFNKDEVEMFFDKQCSVFRGNVGAEFDAMLDALEEECAMVVVGFPDNGRTTVNGVHYVNGVELAESQFKNDPVHPLKESNLIKVLQSQTKRKVGLINFEIVGNGVESLKKEIERKKKEFNYILFDVRDNADLSIIAQAIIDEKIICGSSAIAYYLGLLNDEYKNKTQKKSIESDDKVLCIAGSLTTQTKSQLVYVKEVGYPVITLDTCEILSEDCRKKEVVRIINLYEKLNDKDRMVVIHSENNKEYVDKTKQLGLTLGYNNTQVSEIVSYTLAQISSIIYENHNIKKYIVCGGDTSASFCNKMNINGMRILDEIEAGIPTCETIAEPYLELVLKSGSFGSEEFIEKALKFL